MLWPCTSPRPGCLDLLHAGAQGQDYTECVGRLDWDAFFRWQGGGAFLRELRTDMADRYDHVLVDTSSGTSPSALVCALQMPDDLLFCLGTHPRGIVESGAIARRVSEGRLGHRIRILPVLTRLDQGDREQSDQVRALAYRAFDGLPSGMTEQERWSYWRSVELPYRPFYSYLEVPALFGDEAGTPSSMLSAVERLADVLTSGEVRSALLIENELRRRVLGLFERRRKVAGLDDMIARP